MISEAPVIELSKDRNQEISELSSQSTAEGFVEQGAVEHPTNSDDGFRTQGTVEFHIIVLLVKMHSDSVSPDQFFKHFLGEGGGACPQTPPLSPTQVGHALHAATSSYGHLGKFAYPFQIFILHPCTRFQKCRTPR